LRLSFSFVFFFLFRRVVRSGVPDGFPFVGDALFHSCIMSERAGSFATGNMGGQGQGELIGLPVMETDGAGPFRHLTKLFRALFLLDETATLLG
jgi:hypothetical protein